MTTTAHIEEANEVSRRLNAFSAEVAAAVGVVNAAEAALVRLVARALAEGLWEGWRIHSPHQWLALRAGVSRATAVKIVRLAARADELPVTSALHAEGRLSLDQATAVARYTPAEFEASVADVARHATVDQIVRMTATYGFDSDRIERDAKADADNEPRGPRRQVSFGNRSSDEWSLRAVLPADEGALVEEALKDQRERLHAAARENAKARAEAEGRSTTGTDADLGVDQPGWADALLGMAKIAASSSGDGGSVVDRVGVLVHLRAPEEGEGEGWRAEMHMGPTLPDPLRRYLTCDCDIETVWERDGRPISTHAGDRTPPRRLRRLVMHRDRTCRVPGCTHHLWLQVHHVVHWEEGGPTVTANLICLCAFHHRLHHQGWLGIDGDADATTGPEVVRFTLPTGELVAPPPSPTPPLPTDMPDVAPYQGPTGERLQSRWVHFDRTRDGIDTERALRTQP